MTALSESDVFGMLRQKLTKPGNGGAGEYALLPQVRNAAGFRADRTFDAVAVSLWPSRGYTLHAYEIKCSRADWLRELKEPAKAEAAAKCCDKFSIVAAAPGIVKDGELPPTWGLLVVHGESLRTVVAAPLLPGADPKRPVPRTFLVPMLRSAGAATVGTPMECQAARREGEAAALARYERDLSKTRADLQGLRDQVAAFEATAGVRLDGWGGPRPEVVGAALRLVLDGEQATRAAERRLKDARTSLLSALATIDGLLPADEPTVG